MAGGNSSTGSSGGELRQSAGAGLPALGADAAGAALDLAVHVQEAGAVTLGLLGADLRGGDAHTGLGPSGSRHPFLDHSPCPS